MANRIDELNTSYLIPGIDLGTESIDEVDEADDDLSYHPYGGLLNQRLEPSVPGNWQDLFGLGRVMPEPTQMDPPPRPTIIDGQIASGKDAFFRSMHITGSRFSSDTQSDLKVQRMLKLMHSSIQAVRGLRARAAEVNYQ